MSWKRCHVWLSILVVYGFPRTVEARLAWKALRSGHFCDAKYGNLFLGQTEDMCLFEDVIWMSSHWVLWSGQFRGKHDVQKVASDLSEKTFLYQTDFSPRLLSQTEEEGLVQQDRCSLFLSHTPVPQHFRLGLPIGALAILAVSSRHHLLALVSSVKPSKQNTICLQNRFQKICMLCPRERPCLPKDC